MTQTTRVSRAQIRLPLPDETSHPQPSEYWGGAEGSSLDAPPYFTFGPNPHLADLIDTERPPKPVFSAPTDDIAAGKNTYVYDAHTYHTKVPPQGIKLLIEHYTRPGDVVLDPFCGSGMTGVAAVETGRTAILVDLSPAATFIAHNFLTPGSPEQYLDAVNSLLDAAKPLEHALYQTQCPTCAREAVSLYTVWSYNVACYRCGHEFQLWDVARDERPRVRDSKILTKFNCPGCDRLIAKRNLIRCHREPVLIGSAHCKSGNKETTAPPSSSDRALIDGLSYEAIPADLWYPDASFPDGVNTSQAIAAGINSIQKAYTPRALWAMSFLWDRALKWADPAVRSKLVFTLTSLYQRVTVFSEFRFWGGSGNIANYSVPMIMNEQNVFRAFERKAKTILWYLNSAPRLPRHFRISTQSACHLTQLPDNSVDFIFADPPFGANINYSEMNFLWESWLRHYTDPTEEAIVNHVQGKSVDHYEWLLASSFAEMHRVLKSDAWLVLVFHNSSSPVWRALQGALTSSGFEILGTQTFDKKHGTFKQFVSDNAVGYDLVIHCRKHLSARPRVQPARGDNQTSASNFITARLRGNGAAYTVRYLHVKRPDELDYRRLYAEWLASVLQSQQVHLGFDHFRALVDQALAEQAPDVDKTQQAGNGEE